MKILRMYEFWIGLAALIVIAIGLIFLANSATAGIGPNGFAFYAKKGIVNELNAVYGKNNVPYTVSCSDNPNFRDISDKVTCIIKEK